MSQVVVRDNGGYIRVAVAGRLDMALALSSMEQIRALVERRQPARLLYDLRQLQLSSTTAIAEYAKRFHDQLGSMVSRLAVVVADYQVLERVGNVFADFDQHRTFYDASSAEQWLNATE